MKRQRKWWVLFLGTIIFVGLIIHGSMSFKRESLEIYNNYKMEELRNIADLQIKHIRQDYETKIQSLMVLAEKIAGMDTKDRNIIENDLQLIAGWDLFNYVGMSNQEGNAVDSAGNYTNIKDRSYFQEVMNGKSASISNVLSSKVVDGDSVQIMAVPIVEDGITTGAVFGIHNVKMIASTLNNNTDSAIYTEIIDANGVPVTLFEDSEWLKGYSTVWEFYENSEFIEGSMDEVQKNIKDLQSGYYTLKNGDEQRITYYTPLGIEKYYIYSNIDISLIEEMMGKIHGLTNHAILELIIALAIFGAAVFSFSRKTFSQLKSSYESAVSNEKIMQLALQDSNMFLFEYDSKNKVLRRKTSERHILFPDVVTENVPDALLQTTMIPSKFKGKIADAFEQIKQKESVTVTIKTTPEYQSLWLEISMKNIYDQKERILNTIGSIKNVTDVKRQEGLRLKAEQREKLHKQKAERDGLTGLYNSVTAIEKIENILKSEQASEGKHLLVFMDLDNFKEVNDTFGHQYGNQVLIEMAAIFSNQFRRGDIVGRFGGDEFFAFLLNTRGFEKMEYVFQRLVKECNKEYKKDGISIKVSASFGIAVAPDHGVTYEELSQKADEMLLAVKREHKNGYRLYQS